MPKVGGKVAKVNSVLVEIKRQLNSCVRKTPKNVLFVLPIICRSEKFSNFAAACEPGDGNRVRIPPTEPLL